jgi:hypothetical protein
MTSSPFIVTHHTRGQICPSRGTLFIFSASTNVASGVAIVSALDEEKICDVGLSTPIRRFQRRWKASFWQAERRLSDSADIVFTLGLLVLLFELLVVSEGVERLLVVDGSDGIFEYFVIGVSVVLLPLFPPVVRIRV